MDVDLIITLWDRTEGHTNYNSVIIPRILQFVNYSCRVVVQIDQPSDKNWNILNNLKNEGKIHELYKADHPSEHRPIDINSIFFQAFSHIKSKYVMHIDGDMILYRRGHDDWLEKFIDIIEKKKQGIAAICHSAPCRRDDFSFRKTYTRFMKLEWVSTRFFVTEAETIKMALEKKDQIGNSPLEGWLWKIRLANTTIDGIYGGPIFHDEDRLKSIVIPFDPTFLIFHVEQLSGWKEDTYDRYIRVLNGEEGEEKRAILIKNFFASNFGDIDGFDRDFTDEWKSGIWNKIIYENITKDGKIIADNRTSGGKSTFVDIFKIDEYEKGKDASDEFEEGYCGKQKFDNCWKRWFEDMEKLGYIGPKPGQNYYEIRSLVNHLLDTSYLRKLGVVLEIGTHLGGSFINWINFATDDALIIGIDNSRELYDRLGMVDVFRKWLKEGQKFEMVMGDSQDIETFEKVRSILLDNDVDGIDFLFFDGSHKLEDITKDWEMYSKLVKKDGVIAFHDVGLEGGNRDEKTLGGWFWNILKKEAIQKEYIVKGIYSRDADICGTYGAGIGLIIKDDRRERK